MILYSHDRFKRDREDADPQWLERARRRGVVDTFQRARSYWAVIDFLNKRPAYSSQQYLSLGEAAEALSAKLQIVHVMAATDAALHFDLDDLRARYVVARYFSNKRRNRPESWT